MLKTRNSCTGTIAYRCWLLIIMALLVSLPATLPAAVLAHDASNDGAYDDAFPQWDDGDNGGFGFTAWTLSPFPGTANAGFFTGDAGQNGTGGSSGGAINATDGDAWGLYANGGGLAVAYRGFDFNSDATLDALPVGGAFYILMDNGWNDANVGFVLRSGNDTGNKNGGQRLEFRHTAGGNYLINDNSGDVDTGVGWTADGLSLVLTLTGTDAYSMSITPIGGMTTVIQGNLGGSGAINSFALYNENAGSGQNYDLFFNNVSVQDDASSSAVPEPGVIVLLIGGLLLAVHGRRSRPPISVVAALRGS